MGKSGRAHIVASKLRRPSTLFLACNAARTEGKIKVGTIIRLRWPSYKSPREKHCN